MSYGDEHLAPLVVLPRPKQLDAAGAKANAACLVRSLKLLQEHFGERFGEGPQVQLWHALDELGAVASELEAALATLLERPKRIPSQGELLDGLLEDFPMGVRSDR